jgi:MFS family permease
MFTMLILALGEVIKAIVRSSDNLPLHTARGLAGVVGLAAMVVAIGLGVILSIRIGIGADAGKNPSFTWWVVNRLAFLVPAINLAGFILFFLQERFEDLSQEKAAAPAATAVMFVGVFVLLAALPGGWLADRFGKKPLIAASGLLAALGTFTVLSIPQLWVVNVGACLIGAGVGLFYTANWALGTELVPKEQAGRYLGISNLAGAGAGAIGAYLGGPIADNVGYVTLFAVYGALFLVAGLPLLRIQERRG